MTELCERYQQLPNGWGSNALLHCMPKRSSICAPSDSCMPKRQEVSRAMVHVKTLLLALL